MSEKQDIERLSNKAFLSAEELFKWRKRENLSVPQRGGAKDFEPDGSWLEAKRLEAFYEEQCSVLAEPRVEKSGNLVKGTWNADLCLVNIEKTAKFWMKMGFADQNRNWLHPEEALFLMEVNCLDVSFQGLQLSLQEAYSLFLAPATDVTIEEYQVYSHLHRLGYIVIRHQGRLAVTAYEKTIGLDKHVKKKKKHRKKREESASFDGKKEDAAKTADGVQERMEVNDVDGNDHPNVDGVQNASASSGFVSTETSPQDGKSDSLDKGPDTSQRSPALKRRTPMDDKTDSQISDASEPLVKKMKNNDDSSATHAKSAEQSPHTCDLWSFAVWKSFSKCNGDNSKDYEVTTYTSWDFETIHFPDIAGKGTVTLDIHSTDLLPPNTSLNEEFDDVCMFDVEEYRSRQNDQCLYQPQWHDGDTDYGHLQDLKFSYAEWVQKNSKPVVAKNWGEWKAAMLERSRSSLTETPVANLWRGEVTPVVQPKDSTSTAALLDKLAIIKPFQGLCPAKCRNEAKIMFDVFLPNTIFKKTSPGVPDHRICLAKGEEPPDFFQMQAATAHLKDDVPLHWAVVSCGEISFFVFENFHLPVHLSSLG